MWKDAIIQIVNRIRIIKLRSNYYIEIFKLISELIEFFNFYLKRFLLKSRIIQIRVYEM